jgi:hypothetical protein
METAMSEHPSVGTCYLCNETFKKAAMTRHLAKCAGPAVPPDAATAVEARTGASFHLLVEGRYATAYWMHLAVPTTATLTKLDQFLRDIWLECCGHLSSFAIGGNRYSCSAMAEYGEKRMTVRLDRALEPGLKFSYEYDYGSTTELQLRVIGLRERGTPDGKVQLLARNEAPEVMCQACEQQPATQICVECDCRGNGWLCEACAGEHECGEETMLPVVNSPRTGICGYCG